GCRSRITKPPWASWGSTRAVAAAASRERTRSSSSPDPAAPHLMDPLEAQLERGVDEITCRVQTLCGSRCFVLAITGIDGAGQTTIAGAITARLEARGLTVSTVRADDWHTAAATRFNRTDPGGHFYRNAYRFTE